jgi:hypothetical protein
MLIAPHADQGAARLQNPFMLIDTQCIGIQRLATTRVAVMSHR